MIRSNDSVDALVIGGGPAGLATAIAARRSGLDVIVVDGVTPPIDKPCGEGLMPDGIEALRQIGIIIPDSYSHPMRGIRFIGDDGVAGEAFFPRGSGLGIRRISLHRILLDHASACGVTMRWSNVVTGLHPEGALLNGELVRARWIVGADGTRSLARSWANLSRRNWPLVSRPRSRFGFRRHYRVRPWSDFMEVHWGRFCQLYVTPVSPQEICVAMISRDPKLRLDEAMPEFPELQTRLANAPHTSTERGAITVTHRQRRVYDLRSRVALVGDASGGVDAITGDGLTLAFRQAVLLGDCLADGDLARYQREHKALFRRPTLMAHVMLWMADHPRLRQRVIRRFQADQALFAGILNLHFGYGSTREHLSKGLSLGWNLLNA